MSENFLTQIFLFAGLPGDVLEVLAGRMRRRRYPADAPIVYRGDRSEALYVILSGRVKVHQATASGDDVIIDIKGAGDYFGEMALIEREPRSADVTTIEPSELAQMDGEDLRKVMEEQPAIAWALLRNLSQKVREQNERIEMLATRDVAGRVAATLLKLAASQGTALPPDSRRIRIEANLTQSDIAAIVGATRERVSRALSSFAKQGAILWDKGGKRWIICNQVALRKRADMV